MQNKPQLNLITGNKNKLIEFSQILGDSVTLNNINIDLPELQGASKEEIAIEKVKIAYQQTKKAVLVEDTSLCFNALNDMPGPYIKWFMKSLGLDGLNKILDGYQDKSAYACCIISYMSPELQEPILFTGKTHGKIVQKRQKEGIEAFGWDPVFQPEGYDLTFAEMPLSEKNKISHRYKAIQELQKYFSIPEINLITGNKNKLKEFQQILGDSIRINSFDCDLPELQGTKEEIASEKALIAFKQANRPVIVEDTSLCFNSLDGLPGPYIKWFLKSLGTEGLPRLLADFQDKSAYACCIISYMSHDIKEPILFVGKTDGIIVKARKIEGQEAFGWDPIFRPEGFNQTYAEMTKDQKNKISHRYRAIQKMQEYFKSFQDSQQNLSEENRKQIREQHLNESRQQQQQKQQNQ